LDFEGFTGIFFFVAGRVRGERRGMTRALAGAPIFFFIGFPFFSGF
jgi:hypothetical protein